MIEKHFFCMKNFEMLYMRDSCCSEFVLIAQKCFLNELFLFVSQREHLQSYSRIGTVRIIGEDLIQLYKIRIQKQVVAVFNI